MTYLVRRILKTDYGFENFPTVNPDLIKGKDTGEIKAPGFHRCSVTAVYLKIAFQWGFWMCARVSSTFDKPSPSATKFQEILESDKRSVVIRQTKKQKIFHCLFLL